MPNVSPAPAHRPEVQEEPLGAIANEALSVEARYRGAFIDARQIAVPARRSGAGPATLFAGGAALVLVALAIFFADVRLSAADEEALRVHLAAGGTHGSFAPPPRSSASSVFAFLALAGGVALAGLGFARRGERRPRYLLGASKGADAPVAPEYTDGQPFAVVEAREGGCVVNVTPWMTGEIMVAPRVAVPLPLWVQQRGTSFALPAGSQARLACGALELVVSPSAREETLRPPLFAPSWREHQYTLGTALGLLAGLCVIAIVPPDARALSMDDLGASARFAIANIVPPEPKELPPMPGQEHGGSASEAHKGPEGALGKEHPRQRNGRLAIKGTSKEQQIARAPSADDIRQTGALAVLARAQSGILASVLGTRTLGPDAADVIGTLNSDPIGEAYGVHGFGVRSTGAGGGGQNEGTIGDARLHTIGRGCVGADCEGGGSYGRGVGDFAPRRTRPISIVTSGDVITRGTLDKEIIRRVIRQHINEVKFCYEQQLVRNPQLEGRISISFTIAGTGAVAASLLASSTMGNAHVEGCIVEAVRRWQFPSPQHNGIVIATYPFSFTPAGR
jgi:hypothetical protein